MTRTRAILYRKLGLILPMLALVGAAGPGRAPESAGTASDRCDRVALMTAAGLGMPTARIETAKLIGPAMRQREAGSATSQGAPEHCLVEGIVREREGTDGQQYAVRFRVRLPVAWNGRFLFQGGGGTNGSVGSALGPIMPNVTAGMNALERGFAVAATDTGHDNKLNYDKARGGIMAFGHDFEARAELADRSSDSVATVAKSLIAAFYGRAAARSYFVGCSNGGYTGMTFAQRYPSQFDGIYSGAPAIAVPKASIASIWQSQRLATAARADGRLDRAGLPDFGAVFSNADLKLASSAVAQVCDARDGLRDGLIQDVEACTTGRVEPAMRKLACTAGKTDTCLTGAQIDALVGLHQAPRNRAGQDLYTAFPWDVGMTNPDWRFWKLNMGDALPANVSLMSAGLAAVFMTPPVAVEDTREANLAFALGFDFDVDAPRIFAATGDFPRSGWDLFDGQSDNLEAFRQRGGKIIIAHGSADPVFSIVDTARWLRMVDGRQAGRAGDFVRLFNVPGQDHCGSGNAVDEFDPLTPLMDWVERGRAPDRIVASAGASTPWPGRSRPLCPYPLIATYRGGDQESAGSFACLPSER